MTYLFGRRAEVLIDALKVEGLDVKFNISADAQNLGKAEISIYNLNSEHRKTVETSDKMEVSLSVGYQEVDLDLLFKGDMRAGESNKEGPDWITTLRTGDGDEVKKVRINQSYKPKTPFTLVWKDIINKLKDEALIGVGNALTKFQEGKGAEGITEFLQGGAVQGSVMKEAKRLARMQGFDLGVQDKELVLTPIGGSSNTTAVKLTPKNGLVGYPKKGAKGLLKVRSLLIPGLKPLRKVQIESRDVSGLYVIKSVQYKGDTSGNDWYADMECEEAK